MKGKDKNLEKIKKLLEQLDQDDLKKLLVSLTKKKKAA